jgi:hypothetical protein
VSPTTTLKNISSTSLMRLLCCSIKHRRSDCGINESEELVKREKPAIKILAEF